MVTSVNNFDCLLYVLWSWYMFVPYVLVWRQCFMCLWFCLVAVVHLCTKYLYVILLSLVIYSAAKESFSPQSWYTHCCELPCYLIEGTFGQIILCPSRWSQATYSIYKSCSQSIYTIIIFAIQSAVYAGIACSIPWRQCYLFCQCIIFLCNRFCWWQFEFYYQCSMC